MSEVAIVHVDQIISEDDLKKILKAVVDQRGHLSLLDGVDLPEAKATLILFDQVMASLERQLKNMKMRVLLSQLASTTSSSSSPDDGSSTIVSQLIVLTSESDHKEVNDMLSIYKAAKQLASSVLRRIDSSTLAQLMPSDQLKFINELRAVEAAPAIAAPTEQKTATTTRTPSLSAAAATAQHDSSKKAVLTFVISALTAAGGALTALAVHK
jgi:hypothetical protein